MKTNRYWKDRYSKSRHTIVWEELTEKKGSQSFLTPTIYWWSKKQERCTMFPHLNGRKGKCETVEMNFHPLSKHLHIDIVNACIAIRGPFPFYLRKLFRINIRKGGIGPVIQFLQICMDILVVTFYVFFNGPVLCKAHHVRLAFFHLSGQLSTISRSKLAMRTYYPIYSF